MKTKTKGDDKQGKNSEELSERLQDVREHDHIDAKLREFPHEEHQVKPWQPNSNGTQAASPITAPLFVRKKKEEN